MWTGSPTGRNVPISAVVIGGARIRLFGMVPLPGVVRLQGISYAVMRSRSLAATVAVWSFGRVGRTSLFTALLHHKYTDGRPHSPIDHTCLMVLSASNNVMVALVGVPSLKFHGRPFQPLHIQNHYIPMLTSLSSASMFILHYHRCTSDNPPVTSPIAPSP